MRAQGLDGVDVCRRLILVGALGAAACGDDGGAPSPVDGSGACDFEAVDGVLVIEAESLPVTEAWSVGSDGDASGGFFVEWTDGSNNQDTSRGRFEVRLRFDDPGLYRLQIRNRVGRGNEPTEHNDTWFRFPDVADFFAFKGPADDQRRVYPRPRCNDDEVTGMVEARDDVRRVRCPEGSSRDGYFKVYSSSALDWRWSARTSDNDPHEVHVEVAEPGVYTMGMAARGDFHQLDRIVLHGASLGDAVVQDFGLAETRCD